MARKLTITFGVALALFFLLTHVAFAQDNDNGSQIIQIKHSILTVQELEQHGLITSAEADRSIAYYVAQASKVAGHQLTLQQILAMPDPTPQTLTPLQEFAGAIDFLNVMMTLAIIALGSALIYLFRHYVQKLFHLLKEVPLLVYELVFYLASLGCGIGGWFAPSPMHQYLALLACLLFAGALGFSASRRRVLAHVFLFSMLLFLVWAPVALLFDSAFIGFFAVGALLSALGFNVLADGLFDVFHVRFRGRTVVVENATLGAFLVLTLFVGIHLFGTFIPVLTVFELGALILGSLVGYGGLLILSDRWHWRRRNDKQQRRYWGFQIVSIVAGLGALFFGSLLKISELQKIGGTFFVIYCLVKVAEIPTRSRPAFAVLIAAVSLLAIGFCWFALAHSELFHQWLFLPG